MGGNGDTAVAVDGVGIGYATVSAGAQSKADASDGDGSCWGMLCAAALHAEVTSAGGGIGATYDAAGTGVVAADAYNKTAPLRLRKKGATRTLVACACAAPPCSKSGAPLGNGESGAALPSGGVGRALPLVCHNAGKGRRRMVGWSGPRCRCGDGEQRWLDAIKEERARRRGVYWQCVRWWPRARCARIGPN